MSITVKVFPNDSKQPFDILLQGNKDDFMRIHPIISLPNDMAIKDYNISESEDKQQIKLIDAVLIPRAEAVY